MKNAAWRIDFIIFTVSVSSQLGRKLIILCGYLGMGVCLVAASGLILGFGLEADQLSSDRTIAGYLVVVCFALLVAVGSYVV